MANELDKTIAELEAEVLEELEEANGADAPKAGAGSPEAMPKLKTDGAEGATQDIGGATPMAKVEKGANEDRSEKAIGKKAAAASKEIGGDAQQKSEGKPDKMPKAKGNADGTPTPAVPLAASNEIDGDEELSENKMTKAGMIEKLTAAMSGMKKGEMESLYAMYMKQGDEMEEAKSAEAYEKIEKRVKEIEVAEHVEALLKGEGDLSEEFKKKAATVFEAAVKSKVRAEVIRIEEEYQAELKAELTETKEDLSTKVDNYLNYVVEEWMKENELAIERGLKGEIAEDFISGLKQLFEDHYVDIPDERYDVLEAQSEKISKLEAKLDETIEKVVGLKEDNVSLVREKVISESCSDLAETEIEKFKSLTADVEYMDEDTFAEKVNTLKESYFPHTKVMTSAIDDVETGTAQDIDTTGSMAAYMTAIGRTVNSAK